ncbi:MAG: hypothetical protein JW928_01540 [Candidatus Aureabacteria bacterium]|nr:hypothetical protein [Candidatus Auribacterota bacterium]
MKTADLLSRFDSGRLPLEMEGFRVALFNKRYYNGLYIAQRQVSRSGAAMYPIRISVMEDIR